MICACGPQQEFLGCVISDIPHTGLLILAEQHCLCFGAPYWEEVAFLQLKVCKQSHMPAPPSPPHTHSSLSHTHTGIGCHVPWHLSPDNTLRNRLS